MKVDQFLVERFMNTYEQGSELNIAETCVDPFTVREFLTLMDRENFFEDFQKTKLTYGYIEGSPDLRQGLANLYDHMTPDNILIEGGAIGANFLVFYTLVEPGDTVISILPSYQQLYSVARSFGAEVKLMQLRPENRWLVDLDELNGLVDQKTKLIIINNPHNPSGSLIETELLQEICTITEDAGAYLLCDEAYRGLYINSNDSVPSAVDLSDKALVTGSFSKAFSLSGLRLGWVAANSQVIDECLQRRDYTTISTGMIDDALAPLAMKHVDSIYERNLNIIRTNHKMLSSWIEDEPLIDWIPPRAGSVAFLRYNLDIPSEEFCVRLIKEKGTFLVPGSCFEMEGYLRIGYGNNTETLKTGLARLKEFLDEYR
ncbi:MAG: aminotransferase [Candidatus Hodarchaeales archaeon]|jgi:aspartate/methionine/tyrosine aminotransferase